MITTTDWGALCARGTEVEYGGRRWIVVGPAVSAFVLNQHEEGAGRYSMGPNLWVRLERPDGRTTLTAVRVFTEPMTVGEAIAELGKNVEDWYEDRISFEEFTARQDRTWRRIEGKGQRFAGEVARRCVPFDAVSAFVEPPAARCRTSQLGLVAARPPVRCRLEQGHAGTHRFTD